MPLASYTGDTKVDPIIQGAPVTILPQNLDNPAEPPVAFKVTLDARSSARLKCGGGATVRETDFYRIPILGRSAIKAFFLRSEFLAGEAEGGGGEPDSSQC